MSSFSPFDFSLPEEVERDLQGSEFIYCTNPGNAGDCVIACASHRYFDRKGWKYKVVPPNVEPSETNGRVLVYAGGGNLIDMYSQARSFLAKHLAGAKQFILLPHTVRGNEELLASLDDRCTIIAREETSYRHLLQHVTRAKVFLGHDMAFSLDVKGLREDGARRFWPLFSTKDLVWRNTKRMIRQVNRLAQAKGNRKLLSSFRMDIERTDVAIPPANIDVSRAFASDDLMPLNCFETSYRMIKFLDGFQQIDTNRLHVAICGALLGKDVILHANSYSKNEDIYRHSMAGRFPSVVWKG
ncbi:polysaccharide pyruvyl transferase family protein [Planctomyces sp. SH-PL62]|uniref:polysaccharide pyruvyl transferase family protein n=1 Tax=Planctomyces sp. SH-PL62 TaxID=1636152 RepID=UPI00078EE71A|nr:polysaccharide pyruvyl transferase family protein [Planctomyces sp. SH-PL62]AMV37087.1 Polysaccharide pyruvyl transferase [Planctomyces sp. SH-PL62]